MSWVKVDQSWKNVPLFDIVYIETIKLSTYK